MLIAKTVHLKSGTYFNWPIDTDLFLALCDETKGQYQQDLLTGRESWSGSTLKGKAKRYNSRYRQSRNNLLKRLRKVAKEDGAISVSCDYDLDDRKRKVLVIYWRDKVVTIISPWETR